MLKTIKDLVKKNDLCVLSTVSEGRPHCSLMTYLSDDEGHEIYMVSQKGTRKYLNLMQNPNVSLLIDNREERRGQKRSEIKALTVTGDFHFIDDQVKKESIRSRFLKHHPHLDDFMNDRDADIFAVRIRSFQLLDGVKDIFTETLI